MKISVIIPTYKPQAYIWECLNSLVAQTFPYEDFEVVLVLNGCKDPWETEIREYLAKHSALQVNFIQTDQGGVSNARNVALDVARGEYVTFIDDDDYVSPSYLEELYARASPNTISLCYPYAFNDGKPNEQLPYRITDTYNKLSSKGKQKYTRSRKYFSGPCMKLIPMSFIQDRRFDVRFKVGEDSLFMFLISDKYKNVCYTSKNAIYFRRYRENSAITKHDTKKNKIKNVINRMNETSHIYNKGNYSFIFFVTRQLGAIKTIFLFLWR